MTTLAELPESQIENLLNLGGMLSAWTGPYGAEPAPTVQKMLFYEPTDANERVILIRNSGSSGVNDEDLRRPSYMIVMFGRVDESPATVKTRMDDINGWLLENYQSDSIIGVEVLTDVLGPYLTTTGRPFSEITVQLTISRNRTVK